MIDSKHKITENALSCVQNDIIDNKSTFGSGGGLLPYNVSIELSFLEYFPQKKGKYIFTSPPLTVGFGQIGLQRV